jgi:hypothetical protein
MAETVVQANNKAVVNRGRPMAKLDAAQRKAIPTKEFAGPDRSYPIEDRPHAANAKARAKQMLNAGHLSQAEYDKIIARADAKLGEG